MMLLLAFPALTSAFAAELPHRSLLVLERSDVRGSFYGAIFLTLRSEVNANAASLVTIYVENLDLNGTAYEQSLRSDLEIKYRDKPVGVIVAIGAGALEFALCWRGEFWPGVPVVFALVDDATIVPFELPGDITGRITRLRHNAQAVERLLKSLSPDLTKISEILADVRRDDERASDIRVRLRGSQKTPFVRQPVDVNEVVRAVLEFLSVKASANGVTLVSALASTPLSVSDPVQLRQVVSNLVMNGMEALSTSPNGVNRVTARTHLLEDRRIEIAISDSGPGIPPDRLTPVFEPFLTSKDKGMGMGLSIAGTIVRAHGGQIRAENQQGSGSVFRVSLPPAKATL